MKLSDMSMEDLKKTLWLRIFKPEHLESFDDYAVWLEAMLHYPCDVWDEDEELRLIETKQQVARVGGLKIEVYSREHPPPHFHVKSPNINASFDIENCGLLEGRVEPRDKKKIQFWHKHAKQKLIDVWNSTRPTICSVGKYEGT